MVCDLQSGIRPRCTGGAENALDWIVKSGELYGKPSRLSRHRQAVATMPMRRCRNLDGADGQAGSFRGLASAGGSTGLLENGTLCDDVLRTSLRRRCKPCCAKCAVRRRTRQRKGALRRKLAFQFSHVAFWGLGINAAGGFPSPIFGLIDDFNNRVYVQNMNPDHFSVAGFGGCGIVNVKPLRKKSWLRPSKRSSKRPACDHSGRHRSPSRTGGGNALQPLQRSRCTGVGSGGTAQKQSCWKSRCPACQKRWEVVPDSAPRSIPNDLCALLMNTFSSSRHLPSRGRATDDFAVCTGVPKRAL